MVENKYHEKNYLPRFVLFLHIFNSSMKSKILSNPKILTNE